MTQFSAPRFTEKWLNDRETLFVSAEAPLSKTRPWTSIYNYILDGRTRIEPVGYAKRAPDRRLWYLWGYQWNRFSRQWSDLRLFYCREFELEDDPTI